jgi:hypothetical protein
MAIEWDGKVAAPIFTCIATGRTLAPGEVFISALSHDGTDFRRSDYAEEAWPDHESAGWLSWWRRRVPQPDANAARALRLDADVLQSLFADLRHSRERPAQCLCYVIVLCLVRARILRLDGVDHDRDGTPWLLVDHKADAVRLKVRDPQMDPAELAQVQEALLRLIS